MTREEAIEYIDNLHKKILSRFADKVSEKEMQSFCMAIDALKQSERVHAHWIEYERAHYFKCSRCKLPVPYKKAMLHNGARIYNYCPNCGAIMDEEE